MIVKPFILILLGVASISFCQALKDDETFTSTCKDNLTIAGERQMGKFNKSAYLDFIKMQSKNAIAPDQFDQLNLQLVHIYWDTICTIDVGWCFDELAVADVLNYKTEDGSHLYDDLCNRVNLYLYNRGILTMKPTVSPTIYPSAQPSVLASTQPTEQLTASPTLTPSDRPSTSLSLSPSSSPSASPSFLPTGIPTLMPTIPDTEMPSITPSSSPTSHPTIQPSLSPSATISLMPTSLSNVPSGRPSLLPTVSQTYSPSDDHVPSLNPTRAESKSPTISPTVFPSSQHPSYYLSSYPTHSKSNPPTANPTKHPSSKYLSQSPTLYPSISSDVKGSFVLTFSVQFDDNGETKETMEAVISKCANDFLVQKLSELDRNCAIDSSIECPYTAETGVNIFFYSCLDPEVGENRKCALVDLTTMYTGRPNENEDTFWDDSVVTYFSNALRQFISNGDLGICINEPQSFGSTAPTLN